MSTTTPTAEIDLQETIGLLLTPSAGMALSNVQWFQTNQIGVITPGGTPNVATFKPTTTVTTNIYATATETPIN
jgi:hypothetical protein